MRSAALVTIALLLAGCNAPGTGTDEDGAGAAALPEDFEATGEVSGGGDPLIMATGAPCSTPTAGCVSYPFELNASALVTATLTWALPANDFDLYVFANGTPTSDQGTNVVPGPHTSATVEGTLGPGAYEAVIVPFLVSRDSYTLTVTFAEAGAEESA